MYPARADENASPSSLCTSSPARPGGARSASSVACCAHASAKRAQPPRCQASIRRTRRARRTTRQSRPSSSAPAASVCQSSSCSQWARSWARQRWLPFAQSASAPSASTQAPGASFVGRGQAKPEIGPLAPLARNLYVLMAPPAQSLPTPASIEVEEARVRGSPLGELLPEPARQLHCHLHLFEVRRARRAREQMLLEQHPILGNHGATQVLGDELHHLFAQELDAVPCLHLPSPSAKCRSSRARSLDLARWSSTR